MSCRKLEVVVKAALPATRYHSSLILWSEIIFYRLIVCFRSLHLKLQSDFLEFPLDARARYFLHLKFSIWTNLNGWTVQNMQKMDCLSCCSSYLLTQKVLKWTKESSRIWWNAFSDSSRLSSLSSAKSVTVQNQQNLDLFNRFYWPHEDLMMTWQSQAGTPRLAPPSWLSQARKLEIVGEHAIG